MARGEWSFAKSADGFDKHIGNSIPGYAELIRCCAMLSLRFVRDQSRVLDVGCSTATPLRAVRDRNCRSRNGVEWVGIDLEPAFMRSWLAGENDGLRLEIADCLKYRYENISFALALFTVQFLPVRDKLPFLRSICLGMLPGSALVIAEKVYAGTGRMQDALTFPYYDRKLQHFTAREILDKERSLRGQMTLWTEAELRSNLRLAGFHDLELVWANFPFIAILALR